jgi:glutathione synthase/RimK-type ligase-like ATP-grasp enzyme
MTAFALRPRPYGYLIGSDENQKLVLPHHQQRIDVIGATDIQELRPADAADFDLLHISTSYFRQPVRYELDRYLCLLNCVTDSDSNPKTLANIRKLLKGYRGRVINRPEAVEQSSRDQVARALSGIENLVVPSTHRVARRNMGMLKRLEARGLLRVPAIVRAAGTHSGEIIGLCRDFAEVEAAVAAAPGDSIVTEYVDYRSPDGIFRKFRVFAIGDRLIFRHVVFADQWSAHARDRVAFLERHPEMVAEWRHWCEAELSALGDAVVATLHRIRERLPLDYFGVDFGLLPDGRVLLFEANATMNFFPFPSAEEFPFSLRPLEPARAAFEALLEGPGRGRLQGREASSMAD